MRPLRPGDRIIMTEQAPPAFRGVKGTVTRTEALISFVLDKPVAPPYSNVSARAWGVYTTDIMRYLGVRINPKEALEIEARECR